MEIDTPIVFALLLGAGISLVTSAAVTALHAAQIRRAELRATNRSSARNLTSVFIAERDGDGETSDFLRDAEITVMSMTDRKTRERLAGVIRLLREHDLPEVQQLSGINAATAKRVLCDHALDILGAHLRSERLPEVPSVMRKMLSVEGEALSIHSGEAPKPSAPIEKSSVTQRPRHTGTGTGKGTGSTTRKSTKAAKPAPKPSGKSGGRTTGTATEEPTKESAFWDD